MREAFANGRTIFRGVSRWDREWAIQFVHRHGEIRREFRIGQDVKLWLLIGRVSLSLSVVLTCAGLFDGCGEAPNVFSPLPSSSYKGRVNINPEHTRCSMLLSWEDDSQIINMTGNIKFYRSPISQDIQPSLHPMSKTVFPVKKSLGSSARRSS